MKKILPLLWLVSIAQSPLFGQTRLYVHKNADAYVSETKTVAVLPFKTEITLRPRQLKSTTPERLEEMEVNQGLNIQNSMYSWLLIKKERGKLLADIQNTRKTNALLKEAGIEPYDAHDMLASKLCEILGVEAVFVGTFESNQPVSSGAAIGMAIVGGAGITQNATINLNIIHKDDETVVNYLKNLKGSLGSSTDDLINILMRKAARRIPYTKGKD